MPQPPHADDQLFELARSAQLTLLLDLDGTLIPFAATPEAATLDRPAAELLVALQRSGIRLVIASGRPRGLIEPLRSAVPGVQWFAEHGIWSCDDAGAWSGPESAPELDELLRLLAPYAAIQGSRFERKSRSICLHWRLVADELRGELIAGASLTCEEWLEANPDFEKLDGEEALEVRHRAANKGLAVAWARSRDPASRIIALGDDHTDEDMFAALRETDLAIGVGSRRTRALARLADPGAVREFLAWLIDVRATGASRPLTSLEYRRSAKIRTPLLVVSNRTPVVAAGRGRSVGGLVAALEPALRAHRGMWLGWSGSESEGERRLTIDSDATPSVASFDFPPAWRTHFYGGLCNRALWPLFHGFPGRVRYADEDWLAYVAANREFARHADKLVEPSGSVWVHDYHLLLAGRMLRDRGFNGPLGLFLHVPFPHPDVFATLPWADELVAAMLDFDLIAFHTRRWADNFTACALDRAAATALPEIEVMPIGVDPDCLRADAGPIDRDIAGLRSALGTRKLILGVDRLDYAKGIPERLRAFERLLEAAPRWRGNVSFVQVSVPSRADVPEYAELRHEVEKLVGRINGRFGEADWVPVRYLYRSYELRVLAQLYRLADVALVTPLCDGLNLVAKEFVLAQDPQRPGVLVLSRFAGAAVELHDAVLTNPYHPDGLASDIDVALRMEPPERVRRHSRLLAALADKTPQRWAGAFLERLRLARGEQNKELRTGT